MVPTTCRICHPFGIKAPSRNQFGLSVADIVTVAQAATGAVAPGDDAAGGGQRQTVLEAAAQLDDARNGERAQNVVREKLKKERASDHSSTSSSALMWLACRLFVILLLLVILAASVHERFRVVKGVDETWCCRVEPGAGDRVQVPWVTQVLALAYCC